jgi:hypothetical protein
VNSISLILIMWFDLLHIYFSIENVLKQKKSCFYCKYLNFLDQWIKLLLTWLSLCNDCLETMSYLYISIYLYIYTLSKHNPFKTHFFENLKSTPLSRTMFGPAQIRGYLNPRLLPSSQTRFLSPNKVRSVAPFAKLLPPATDSFKGS